MNTFGIEDDIYHGQHNHGVKSEHEVIAEYHLDFISGDKLSFEHAKAELTKEYDMLYKEANEQLEIYSMLRLGIINNYGIFLYKVAN